MSNLDDMRVGDERYRQTLRRHTTLCWLDNPTPRQRDERARLGAALDAAELRGSVIAAVTDDYDSVRNAGDLGGVEL